MAPDSMLNPYLKERLPQISQEVLDSVEVKANLLSLLHGPDVDYVTVWKEGEKGIEIVYIDPKIEKLIGITREEIYENGWGSHVLRFPEGLSKEEQQRLRESGGITGENVSTYAVKRVEGHQWFEDRSKIHNLQDGFKMSIGKLIPRSETEINRDETLRKLDQRLAKLEKLGECEKTGLLPNSLFQDAVSDRLRLGTSGAFLFFDLDKFKFVNDTFGHDAGDYVLKKWGELLKAHFRGNDLLGRIGGDESAVFLSNVSQIEAKKGAHRFLQAWLDLEILYKGNKLPHGVSIGVAETQVGISYEELRENADKAMYLSKHAGRNRVTVFENNKEGPTA